MYVITLIAVILMALNTVGELFGDNGTPLGFIINLFVTVVLCVLLKGVA